MGSKLRTASWILLTVVGSMVLLAGFLSAYIGYRGDYLIGGVPVAEVAGARPEVLTALRAIRGTSAAYAAAFAVLFLATVTGPYRRGEKRAWWAIALATAVLLAVTAARVPLLGGGTRGVGAAVILGALVLLGLLLDFRRLSS
jgi:hypothetical protein